MAVIQGSSYSPSFEHVCSPKTVRTFKALYMLKCLSKSKSNLIFFPGILYKALGQCGECHSDWCEQQRWSDGILPAFLWKTAPEPKAEKATHLWVLKAISVASRMTSDPAKGLGWRSHLSGSFQLDRKARQNFTQENLPYYPPVPLLWPFISSSGFTAEMPSNELSVSLCTGKCVIFPQVQHNKCCRRHQGTNHGAHLMEAKKNMAVLLLKGCHDTQTYTLPFFVGI